MIVDYKILIDLYLDKKCNICLVNFHILRVLFFSMEMLI